MQQRKTISTLYWLNFVLFYKTRNGSRDGSGHFNTWFWPHITKTFLLAWSRFINQTEFNFSQFLFCFVCLKHVLNVYLLFQTSFFYAPNFLVKMNWKPNSKHSRFLFLIYILFQTFCSSKRQDLKLEYVKQTLNSCPFWPIYTYMLKLQKLPKIIKKEKIQPFTSCSWSKKIRPLDILFPGLISKTNQT